jgi:hypothetical protein
MSELAGGFNVHPAFAARPSTRCRVSAVIKGEPRRARETVERERPRSAARERTVDFGI